MTLSITLIIILIISIVSDFLTRRKNREILELRIKHHEDEKKRDLKMMKALVDQVVDLRERNLLLAECLEKEIPITITIKR